MKYVRFAKDNKVYYGLLNENTVEVLSGNCFGQFCSTNTFLNISEVHILPPCTPSKIICVGLNYKDHASEMGMTLPEEPIIFLKPTSSLIGPEQEIVLPLYSKRVDYEAELGIVISQTAKNISTENAKSYIWGYTCLNDITARDFQKTDGQWTRSKSFDTFCPLGPWIVNNIDGNNLTISLILNNQVKQLSSTSNMVFPVEYLISYISTIMTLNPGDVIATGTPPGIGPLQPGDKVEVYIDQIGTLINYVK